MPQAEPMIELWRGGLLESVHAGHAVICDARGQVVQAWGDPGTVVFPRSSCKMIQALPLVDSGAADAAGLSDAQLALACASHNGAAVHVGMVGDWLSRLDLAEADLRCGVHEPHDRAERQRLIRAEEAPCQLHNNCSGKHAGFLTLTRHLQAGPEYVELDHPVQQAVAEATADVAGEIPAGHGIDGCSAPNFALTLTGLARAMARFAAAGAGSDARSRAMVRLREAMAAWPALVEGEGSACTELMQAMGGRATIKYGAEGMFSGILPDQGLGIALKIADGTKRAAEMAAAAVLVKLGALDPAHPLARHWLDVPQTNCRGLTTGVLRAAEGLR
jgi:L-asparaginase II